MATGVFFGEGASMAEAERRRRQQEEARLRQQLAGVNWAGLGQLTGTGPRPAGPPAPVGGGRGSAVNTVGQSGGPRPGATGIGQAVMPPSYSPGGGRGSAVNTVGQPGGPRPGLGQSQMDLAASIIAGAGPGLAGGGFWEGGDIYVDPVTGRTRPTDAALENLRADDPWANVNWAGLGQLLTNAGIPLQGSRPSTGSSAIDPGGFTLPGRDGSGTGGTGGTGGAPGAVPPNAVLQDLLAALTSATETARGKITGAGEQLLAGLQSRDPMSAFEWSRPSTTIPTATLANYVQAIGGSPAEVEATQRLNQELLGSYLGDVGQFAGGVESAQTGWRGRQEDVARQMQADALAQLALNEQAQRIAINMGERNRQQSLQDQALAMLLNYATARPAAGGGALNVTMPNLPFNTVNIPGVGNVYIPSTLGGLV